MKKALTLDGETDEGRPFGPPYCTVRTRLLLLTVLPAVLVGAVFEIFLHHRHDYSGHYAAGYGATLAAAMFCLRLYEESAFLWHVGRFVLPFCFVCVSGGALAEATAFRIAKFDEIDFCNQSLGAVLATLCASAYIGLRGQVSEAYDDGMIVGIAFLGAGGCLAVA
ncbi:MAG: hypothetical protein AB7F89_08380 [Pirellulaceae bacterium]